jgi:hypothetical protein
MDTLLESAGCKQVIIVDGILEIGLPITLGMITLKNSKIVKQHTLKFKLNAIRRVLTKCKLNLVILFKYLVLRIVFYM